MSIYAQNWKQRVAEHLFRLTQKLVGYPQCWAVPWHHDGKHVDPVTWDGKEQTCTWCGSQYGIYHTPAEQHETYTIPKWAQPQVDAAKERKG